MQSTLRIRKEAIYRGQYSFGRDMVSALHCALQQEESPTGKQVLEKIIENADIACREEMPICQDTGWPFCLSKWVRMSGLSGEIYERPLKKV